MNIRRIVFAATTWSFILSSGSALGMGTSPQRPDIRIERQEVRLSPVMMGVGSVFMEIINSGNGGDNLIAARTGIPNTVTELHDVKDGKMARVEKIRIPSATTVKLRPMSLHVMIFKMPEHFKDGYEFTLYLQFEKSGEKSVPLIVKASETKRRH